MDDPEHRRSQRGATAVLRMSEPARAAERRLCNFSINRGMLSVQRGREESLPRPSAAGMLPSSLQGCIHSVSWKGLFASSPPLIEKVHGFGLIR